MPYKGILIGVMILIGPLIAYLLSPPTLQAPVIRFRARVQCVIGVFI